MRILALYLLMCTCMLMAQLARAEPPNERLLYEQSLQERLRRPTPEKPFYPPATEGPGSIVANPNPCTISVGQHCQSTIQWSYNQSPISAYIVNPVTLVDSVVATTGPNGSVTPNWIPQWPGHHWELRYNGAVVAQTQNVYARHRAFSARPGGSNYNWYNVGPGNDFIPYGIVARYHLAGVRSTVQGQLAQMYQSGQRELRNMIHFCRTCSGFQTYLNSVEKVDAQGVHYLPRQAQENLTNFLLDIKNARFKRIHLSMGAGHLNLLNESCSEMTPTEFQAYSDENWGITKDVIAVAQASGLDYLIDLYNEGAPSTFATKECYVDYLEETWDRYVANYPISKTVGFSVIVMSEWDAYNRLALIDTVYRGTHPLVIEMHNYASDTNPDGMRALRAANEVVLNILPTSYANLPWIIGETFYNDAAFAAGLRNGSLDTGNKVKYILQWPLAANGDWVVPSAYNQYLSVLDYLFEGNFEQ